MSSGPKKHLARRDYILLPLLSAATAFVLFTLSEAVARAHWPEQKLDTCEIKDPYLRFTARPNCSARVKIMDGPWVENRYNDCGFRSPTACASKIDNAIRIGLLGSSFAQGYMVPYDQTFAARSEQALTNACHRPIDVQNDSQPDISLLDIYHRMDRMLALHPDVVMLVITPLDLERKISSRDLANRDAHLPVDQASVRPPDTGHFRAVREQVSESRAIAVGKMKLFEDPELFLKRFLLLGDNADYLRHPLTKAWEERFSELDLLLGAMDDKAKEHGTQLILVPGIMRPQAAAFESKHLPDGIDPYQFEQRCQAIAQRHGILTVNVYDDFHRHPEADKLFYVLDGHLNASGQEVLAQSLVRQLLGGGVQAFAACRREASSNEHAMR